jgi:hypothetical protein
MGITTPIPSKEKTAEPIIVNQVDLLKATTPSPHPLSATYLLEKPMMLTAVARIKKSAKM